MKDLSYHPVNLLLRFLLELTALVSASMWGYGQATGILGIVLAVLIPLAMATVWGVFAVLGDRSRSGKAPVPVSGIVRLQIELLFFAIAIWCLGNMGYQQLGLGFGIIVMLHYVFSYGRIQWLIKQK